ncbi:MAG: M23 family metallopeptidase [Muribaculaceae bacterium]|nr:M23 family metallopeptidase [Muribaculaceae bacterium]
MLIEENRRLRAQLETVDVRLDRAMKVMDAIAERDNNFYRVMVQAPPLTASQRYGGMSSAEAVASMNDADLVTNVSDKIEMLDRLLYAQIQSFDSLRVMASQQTDRLKHIPSVQPISLLDMKQLASGYGYRVDPVYGTSRFHEGMDFAAQPGTRVNATGDGTVIHAGWKSEYGNLVEVDHGYGYVTRYAHLSKINVKNGETVNRGDKIGEVGSTGKSTGPHLHYEVRYKGVAQPPYKYYFEDLTPEQYVAMISANDASAHVMD